MATKKPKKPLDITEALSILGQDPEILPKKQDPDFVGPVQPPPPVGPVSLAQPGPSGEILSPEAMDALHVERRKSATDKVLGHVDKFIGRHGGGFQETYSGPTAMGGDGPIDKILIAAGYQRPTPGQGRAANPRMEALRRSAMESPGSAHDILKGFVGENPYNFPHGEPTLNDPKFADDIRAYHEALQSPQEQRLQRRLRESDIRSKTGRKAAIESQLGELAGRRRAAGATTPVTDKERADQEAAVGGIAVKEDVLRDAIGDLGPIPHQRAAAPEAQGQPLASPSGPQEPPVDPEAFPRNKGDETVGFDRETWNALNGGETAKQMETAAGGGEPQAQEPQRDLRTFEDMELEALSKAATTYRKPGILDAIAILGSSLDRRQTPQGTMALAQLLRGEPERRSAERSLERLITGRTRATEAGIRAGGMVDAAKERSKGGLDRQKLVNEGNLNVAKERTSGGLLREVVGGEYDLKVEGARSSRPPRPPTPGQRIDQANFHALGQVNAEIGNIRQALRAARMSPDPAIQANIPAMEAKLRELDGLKRQGVEMLHRAKMFSDEEAAMFALGEGMESDDMDPETLEAMREYSERFRRLIPR